MVVNRAKWLSRSFLPAYYRLKHRFKFWCFREHRNIWIGNTTFLHGKANLSATAGGKIHIGESCYVHAYSQLIAQGGAITLGHHVSVNPYTILYGHGGLTIGNNVMIASHSTVIPANHCFSRLDIPMNAQGESRKGIVIGDNVWIGSHVTILDGVTIGAGSVIAAGAVVTKSIPPHSIAGGVPAKIIRSRQAEQEAEAVTH